ncbi:hypothetical protein SAMN02745136_00419 [Anaerocolumna jejuensis DSM 15929]|uniref:Uncharacterized protein n=1 Tax=Anaerocolumna jejuensis DSM 15929 TaxID=1121322 RepID=A0A1M6KDZ0_9FIRM|nr:hypothetical protein [Anaerocolumna jejuensis]SHJ57185.1 hypothetical protein SAMN02745136_00419 [Anaerocolumna jejuensis DSM 15929]
MYKSSLHKPNGTKVVAYTNLGTHSDAGAFKVIKYARMIADKPEGGSQVIPPKKYLRVENAEELKDFKPKAMPGKTQYIVLLLDTKAEAFEEITVNAGSTTSAYALAIKQTVIKENLIAYVYDTSQKPIKGKQPKEIRLDSELRQRLISFSERCDYYRNSFFWTAPSSASNRRYKEDKDSIPQYLFAVGSDYYSIEFNVRCSCKNVYASSSIAKNGCWTTLTTLKTLLNKDVGIGCYANPKPQAS